MRVMIKMSLVPRAATLTLLVLLGGCGQKGPLALPAPAQAASTAAR